MTTEACSSQEQKVQSPAWVQPVIGKLKILFERPLNLSIFMVPNKLRKVNENAYNPRIVSIGPFHSSRSATRLLLQQTSANKDDQYLQAMEEHKWWYTLYLIHRTPKPRETLNACGTAIDKDLGRRVCGSYAGDITLLHHELAEIMLIDGCFILELFIRSWCGSPKTEDGDFIFHNAWMVPTLQQDLALLENQIPFSVLQDLYDIVKPLIAPEHKHPMPSINELALHFFHPDLKLNQESNFREKSSQPRKNCKHLLDLLHNFHLPAPTPKTDPESNKDLKLNQEANRGQCSIPIAIDPEEQETRGFGKCATKLSEAGIVFVKGKKNHLLGIEFNHNHGVIEIPPLCIDEKTESLLRNLIAFEQCSPRSNHQVSSYVILLRSLIHSKQDIELLKQRGIITLNLVGDENILNFFNNISMEIDVKKFYFCELCWDVKKYQKSWWHWHRILAFFKVRSLTYLEALKSEYLSNPWKILSIIAAVVLLLLTSVQTYYAVRSYLNSDDQFLTNNLSLQFDR